MLSVLDLCLLLFVLLLDLLTLLLQLLDDLVAFPDFILRLLNFTLKSSDLAFEHFIRVLKLSVLFGQAVNLRLRALYQQFFVF